MKQKLLMLLILVMSVTLYAQVPTYYNDVNLNLTGQSLKDELAVKITTTHTTFLSYTPGVWDALKLADLDPNNSNNVLLIYGYNDTDGNLQTDRSRSKNLNGGGSGEWNREHSYPKSLGNPNLGTSGPGSDAHHLRASDILMNSSRSNRVYAAGTGNAGITAQGHFYPGDEWKGDVARMMMFMYLRYGSRCLPNNVGIGNAVSGDSNMIDLFLQWNAEDPVNFFEDNRNVVIEGIQGNRNPFIDNPALATQIWGGPQAEDRFGSGGSDTEAPSIPADLIATNTTTSATMLSWTVSIDNIGVTAYDVYQNSSFIATTSTASYSVSGLAAETTYNFYVTAKDAAGNVSANSASVNVTTMTSGGTGSASELFISEYIEGSSNNKAIEVANFTGAPIDLSDYSLKKATNGSGSFSSTFALSGQLANGEVYVVANSSADSTILNQADATNGGVMTFNGNDAVGLFKNDVLIDVLGNANSSANFAKDVTLRRKSAIVNPNTLYTVSEWDSYAQNTFSDLGAHTIDGGSVPDTIAPTVPLGIIASNITETSASLSWTASTDNIAVTGYDVYQDGSLLASVTTISYAVNGLTASTTYSYTVRAIDAAGNVSASSASESVTTATPPDTVAPSVPTSIVASNITETSASLSWTASTDNIAVTGYDVYQDGSLLASVTTTSYAVNGLAASTTYSYTVRAKDAAGNVSASSNAVNVTTDTIVLTYCNSKGNNTNYEYIDYVGLGGISNSTTANGGYGDFTNQVANVTYGSNTIVLSVGFPGSSYTENWKVWIDFNQNGTFESSEEVVTGSTSSTGNLSYSFNIPTSALSGTTRMRVSMKWNAAPTACETFSYGEVEDYTVSIGNTASRNSNINNDIIDGVLTQEDKVFDVKIYSALDVLNIVMADDRSISYVLTNMRGQIVASGKFDRHLKLLNIESGVYTVNITDRRRTIYRKFIKK